MQNSDIDILKSDSSKIVVSQTDNGSSKKTGDPSFINSFFSNTNNIIGTIAGMILIISTISAITYKKKRKTK